MTAVEAIKEAQAEDQANVLELTTCLLLRFHKTGLIRKGNIAKIQDMPERAINLDDDDEEEEGDE